MGLFTSFCKNADCGKRIYWFLEVDDRVCDKCGALNTREEIKKSWWDNYEEHLNEVRRSSDLGSE